jgi:hypothetical protein
MEAVILGLLATTGWIMIKLVNTWFVVVAVIDN